MKLSQIINYPLGLLGLKIIRKSRLELVNVCDIDQDTKFISIYNKVRPYTLVPIERCFTLYQAVKYIIKNNIEGDFVECGVWKGGSCMLIAYTLMESGDSTRRIWLYDTFEGMTQPGEMDGEEEKKQWNEGVVNETRNNMCFAPIGEVRSNLDRTGYPSANFELVKGKVEETIPSKMPAKICLLRLDTDWYESTKHELKHLYPLVSKNGMLIVDDYGAWQGSRKAVDEYFENVPNVFLGRIDYTGRIVIK